MLLVALLFLAASGVVLRLLFEWEKPAVLLDAGVKILGERVEMPFAARDGKSGLKELSIALHQDGKSVPLFTQHFPRESWFGRVGPDEYRGKLVIKVKEKAFAEGPAELVLTARDHSLFGFFKGNQASVSQTVMIDTAPPRITLTAVSPAVSAGGSAVVTYRLSELPARHGVMIGKDFFPGYPDKIEGSYVAYFALPWDAGDVNPAMLVATDAAGNEAKTGFTAIFKPRAQKHDTLTISDAFLQEKLPEFQQRYPEMQGSPLDQYLYVNGVVRQENAARIAEICAQSGPERFWKGRFARMPGAGRAGFADQRTYMYQGRAVDTQTHMGVDIASTVRAEVRAANRGRVIFAGYLGIYGNMVVLDHGQGLFSLYAHLSEIKTTVGQVLEQNQLLGLSGKSGMAGGDHLHFAMLVHGVFVTPIEWWDRHWIAVNIEAAFHE